LLENDPFWADDDTPWSAVKFKEKQNLYCPKPLKFQIDKKKNKDIIAILNTARIDIKNSQKNNKKSDIKITHIDRYIIVEKPAWFADENGTGYVIKKFGNSAKFEIVALNDGEISIYLRSNDIRRDGRRINFFIDYTNLSIDGKEFLSEIYAVSHDVPKLYKFAIKQGEKRTIEVAWNMHTYPSSVLRQLAMELSQSD